VHGNVGLLAPIRDYVDALVHPSARRDALTSARHRAFIAPRLLGSLVAFAVFPVYLTVRGVPSPLEVLAFAWLVAPILIVCFLSRTGRYEAAHVLSSLSLTGLVTVVAVGTGGVGSFAAIWLVVVPLEAALSASRRVVAVASTFALGAAGLLLITGELGLVSTAEWGRDQATLAALGLVSAALYAAGLALGTVSLVRTSFWLLFAEEDRYRLLAGNMTDVIARHGRNGALLFVSPAAEQLFGANVQDLLGHGLFDRVHVADRPAYLTALSDAAAYGQSRSVEFRVRRESAGTVVAAPGQFIWIDMRCRPLDRALSEGSSDREVVAVMRDTTERKAQEQALENARVEAERANVAKSRFLAIMSHELRTPLNAIIGFSEMLTNEDALPIGPERRHEYARLINDSGHHLLAVVNGILDMSKIESGNFEIRPEPIAPAEVIGDACGMLALKARDAGIELVVRLPDKLPRIVADRRALSQILINLISNAIKFTDRGGRVVVSAAAQAGSIVATVEDNGVGIAKEDLPRVGDPFFQALSSYDRRYDGTGLGLSIVKGLLALQGGRLEIHSRLGEGTRVCAHLPIDCRSGQSGEQAGGGPAVERLVPHGADEPANIAVKKSA
jgi:cell cycle sensor histidine kinase DivJ